jgi:hypothetical protein
MQKCRAPSAAFNLPRAVALLGAFFFTGDIANSDPRPPSTSETGAPSSNCDPDGVIVYQADRGPEANVACASDAEIATEDRDYLIATATPGSTMVRQGPELAIGRLHPEFVRRLASAIREARQAGLATAGIFSAYRPPAFGVGGFSDKFNSLHTYGLAVDMSGIGGPGTAEARLWYEIAAKHGVACPYGFESRVEWNHCQPTRMRLVVPKSPLRDTVTASGPIDLDSMFEAGNSFIESPQSVADAVRSEATGPVASRHVDMADDRMREQSRAAAGNAVARRRLGKANDPARTAKTEARSEPPNRCKPLHHSRADVCGGSRQVETATRMQGVHPRQASTNVPRHHT